MIDIGVNLTHPSMLNNLDDNIEQWQQAGVNTIIAIASNLSESHELNTISARYADKIWHTIGCHPHNADDWTHTSKAEATSLIPVASHCIAIGETGLDFNRNYSSQTNQILSFEEQIQLSLEFSLPLYLHEREAEATLQSILVNQIGQEVHGVLHCFTSSKESVKRYLDLGLYIGITGWICDERRGQELQEAIRYIPKDRILLETDSPYLLPRTLKPKPKKNHPKFLSHILEQAAIFSGIDVIELKTLSIQNSQKLFNLPV